MPAEDLKCLRDTHARYQENVVKTRSYKPRNGEMAYTLFVRFAGCNKRRIIERVDFDTGQGRSYLATAGVAQLRRGLPDGENTVQD